MAKPFGELIYTPETTGPAASKAETHAPKIEAPDTVKKGEPFKITIKVGPHPNQVQHSIRRIEIWFSEEGRAFNPIHIATIDLEPVYAEPEITITIRLEKSGTLYVLSYCNLHGVWETHKDVKVEE
ncbi:putative desulfoferrodoxin [Pyrodictium delaneyi]|uniref:Desulfoferrodoxin n=1 Tax=Pyrodictium delaneyi TaxID=1273541 RepID=A0A0P0N1F4_9CREN|nr:class II SORL domain-containing protein [Pyrodictium delaneyi]ALL00084.1 putative desulfoferrodoxin [Pyrodictium delaneyi]OWJ54750.1 desulfoferrodoxin [Pyrodictium delaneyi]